MLDEEKENLQPDAAVEAKLEESQSTPQGSDTESEYFFEEGEADQLDTANNKVLQQRAAFAKSKAKARAAEEREEQTKRENAALQARIEALESGVASVTRGSKPTLASCDYDEDKYESAIDSWYSTSPAKSADKPKVEQQQNNNGDYEEAEFYYHQKASELKSKLNDYDDYEAKAKEAFGTYGVNPDQFTTQLAFIAHDSEVDIAKAMYAFGRQPALVKKLSQARTQIQMAKVLKEAAGKIQTRERKALDTKPTPNISGGGAINNQQKALDKAIAQYAETGSRADYLKIVSIRKQK